MRPIICPWTVRQRNDVLTSHTQHQVKSKNTPDRPSSTYKYIFWSLQRRQHTSFLKTVQRFHSIRRTPLLAIEQIKLPCRQPPNHTKSCAANDKKAVLVPTKSTTSIMKGVSYPSASTCVWEDHIYSLQQSTPITPHTTFVQLWHVDRGQSPTRDVCPALW